MNINILDILRKEKLIVILRNVPFEKLKYVLDILKAENIKLIEIALNSKNVKEQFDFIKKFYKNDFIVGAGTVTDLAKLNSAIGYGIQFFLTPNINEEVLKKAEEKNIFCIPGFFSCTEAYIAQNYSCCQVLKLFPAGDLPKSYLKSLKGPLDNFNCIAVGGVNKDNLSDFLSAGFIGVGMGSSLINPQLIQSESFEKIRENIKEVKSIIKNFI